MAMINQAREVGAADSLADSAPELAGAKPLFPVLRNGSARYLVEPQLLAFERPPGIARLIRAFLRQPVEGFGIHAIDQMNIAAKEPRQLQIPILLNGEAHGIDVRQAPPLLVLLP